MIFVTVGTELPFDRLARAVDEWSGTRSRSDVYGQLADLGAKGYRPSHFEWCSFLPPTEYEKRFKEADLIVAHAGMGSIITAMTSAKPIVIMPRMAELTEHRNDHQMATAQRFGQRPGIFLASDETELPDILDRALLESGSWKVAPAGSPFADPMLVETIRKFIMNG